MNEIVEFSDSLLLDLVGYRLRLETESRLITRTCSISTARRDLPLGIEDYKINGRYLSASTEWNKYHGARFARLNSVARGRNKGAWSAKRNNRRQWIMVSGFPCTYFLKLLSFVFICF